MRYARGEVRLDGGYAILGEEKCAKAGLEGEVAELRNVVVGEINGVVVLQNVLVENSWGERAGSGQLTRAAPMFSMAEIL